MLAGMRALVFAHHGEGLLGDRAHLLDVDLLLEVEHGPHMEAADRGMRVPGAVGAVLLEHGGEPRRVIREVVERHGAVLDEGDRLPVPLHRHHDVEAFLAHVPHRLLEGGVGGLDHGAGEAEIAHQLDQLHQPPPDVVGVLAGEFDEQQRRRLALDEAVDGGAEHGNVARQVDHGAVDQLDRGRAQRHDAPGRRHRLVESREMADAEHAVRRDRLQLELDGIEEGERALRADQQMRHVVAGIVDHVDVVAADPAQQLGEALGDLGRFAPVQRAHVAHEVAIALGCDAVIEIAGHLAHARRRAVGQERVDSAHVVHHVAVAQAARAAAVVGGHAADGGAIAGRDVDREEQAVRLQRLVEAVEHHARLDQRAAPLDIDGEDAVHVLAAIDDEGAADGLAALRGAAAARQDRHALLAGDGERRRDVLLVARHDHAQRLDLVDRRIGAVAAAAERVEQHLAAQILPQPRRERRGARLDRASPRQLCHQSPPRCSAEYRAATAGNARRRWRCAPRRARPASPC